MGLSSAATTCCHHAVIVCVLKVQCNLRLAFLSCANHGVGTVVASGLRQTHSFKQPFENAFSEEARLGLFIKTIHVTSIYQLPSAKCNWVMVRRAYHSSLASGRSEVLDGLEVLRS